MLLSKLKLKTSRVRTVDESVHFHLDEQEEQIALEAKKQLQAFSQEVFDDVRQSEILNSTKEMAKKTNLRESTMTRATENETKSFCNKPSNRTTRQKSSCKCHSLPKNQQKCQKSVSPKKQPYGLVSSVKLQGNFENDLVIKEKFYINRYFNKVQAPNQRKLQKTGLCGVTFRSHTLQPESKNSLRSYRKYTSRRQLSSCRPQQIQTYEESKPYSFNQTMSGVKKYKSPVVQSPRQLKLFKQQQGRPTTCRESGVNLRPQFLRLIMRIKQKQEAECKKKVMVIKGRRSKY